MHYKLKYGTELFHPLFYNICLKFNYFLLQMLKTWYLGQQKALVSWPDNYTHKLVCKPLISKSQMKSEIIRIFHFPESYIVT